MERQLAPLLARLGERGTAQAPAATAAPTKQEPAAGRQAAWLPEPEPMSAQPVEAARGYAQQHLDEELTEEARDTRDTLCPCPPPRPRRALPTPSPSCVRTARAALQAGDDGVGVGGAGHGGHEAAGAGGYAYASQPLEEPVTDVGLLEADC